MSGSKFRTQRLDRVNTAIKSATSSVTGLVTGNIGRGEVVIVELDGTANTYSVRARGRATGAIEIARALDADTGVTVVETNGDLLSVTVNNAVTGTLTYWVF